ncbi:resolvase, N terminal domain protein [Clostridioides difficile DA00191]|uniref:recombinase family protein n=1 Tax=Clostridioides difficile TaxID=1496 RepID=UPI00038CD80B|nr:recombinase family protein [Clostridioides difficile]EQG89786.1 resolvase, N terminal domain protein [Clostridioides difficile DA00191]
MKSKKAVVYARFSLDNQRDESIDAQLRAINEYEDKNNIKIVNQFIDRAKSATSIKDQNFKI